MLLQLEKNQEILPSTRDEALFHCGILREFPPFFLSLERVLDTLEATQEVSRHPHLHSRGTPRVPPQLKKSPGFSSSSREEGPFPGFVWKGIPAFPSHTKRRQSQLNTREELQGSCHNSKTLMSQSTPDRPDSTAPTRLLPRVSTKNTMARVTALWHIERKPQIPMSTQQEA